MTGLVKEIEQRRAFRGLKKDKIPDDTIHRIMKAATYAPSCFNSQSWRFVVATGEDALEKIHQALSDGNYWVKKAPMVVVVATKEELDCQLNDRRDYALFDCGLATENLMLQAFKEGLYAHAIAGFEPLKVKELFQIPNEYIVITLVALAFPGDSTHLNKKHKELETSPRNRKPEREVISHDAWEFEE